MPRAIAAIYNFQVKDTATELPIEGAMCVMRVSLGGGEQQNIQRTTDAMGSAIFNFPDGITVHGYGVGKEGYEPLKQPGPPPTFLVIVHLNPVGYEPPTQEIGILPLLIIAGAIIILLLVV